MDATWPDRLGTGDRVRFDGQVCTVTGVRGGRVALRDALGATEHVDVVSLLAAGDFAFLGPDSTRPREQSVPLLPEAALEQTRWWRRHVTEVLGGVPYGAPSGTEPLPAYDPARRTLPEREEAKARELADLGMRGASARTVRRKRQRYQEWGLAGLTDGRAGRHLTDEIPWHPRVEAVVWELLVGHPPGQRLNTDQLHKQVLRQLAAPIAAGELPRPSRSAVRRLAAQLLVRASEGRAGPTLALAVGERVHLDTVELPLPPGGEASDKRLRLLVAIDEATSLVLAAVVHTKHQSPLYATLLARMCAPLQAQESWGALLSGRPWRADRRDVPSLIVRPDTLIVDGANVPGLRVLREACAALGIHVRYAPRLRPTNRQVVERTLSHFTSLFTDHLLSAAGQTAHEAGWPPEMVQDLVNAWMACTWPGTPVPTAPAGGAQTPRTRHETLTASSGWTPTPVPPQQLTALLNVARRVIGPSGLRLGGGVYDSPVLDPLRHAMSRNGGRSPFEVRWDPYDLRRVWLRSGDDEWIMVPSVLPSTVAAAQLALQHTPLAETQTYISTVRRETDTTPRHSDVYDTVPQTASSFQEWPTPFVRLPEPRDDSRTPPDDLRVTYHAQLPLRVPGVMSATRQIEEMLALNQHTRAARHGMLVYGQSGTGKTTALWEAARRCTAQEPVSGAVPVVYVRLPPATSPRLLLAELARSLGLSLRGSPTTADLAARVSEATATARTRLVLVDEAQNFHSPGWSSTAVAETLDYLCDRIPATFAFAGIGSPESLTATVMPTPCRRLVPVQLGLLPDDDTWREVIRWAEQALRLQAHVPGTLAAQADFLHQRTGGNPGHLAFLLRTAAVRAIREGTEQLTAALLSELPLPCQRDENGFSHPAANV
ncbi:AAA family ATPase [Streptomyces sp. NPDC052287]|uniref:AAA family ATPase n=1 Tax=Streptomyces sp. NPDC052287 TaxID=3154950 RepID=UPI0034332D81